MARKIVNEDIAANEIYAKFGKWELKKKWYNYAEKHTEEDGIANVEEYIIEREPELTEWLESLFPYVPSFSTIGDIIADYFRGEYYLGDMKN
jgi:hypothetical protein